MSLNKTGPQSMTGFSRVEREHSWGRLSCEIRSVNHRYLEPTLRLSESLRSMESKFRDMLRKRLSRGKIEVSVYLKTESLDEVGLGLNVQLAKQISSMAEQIAADLSNPAKINAMEILAWPGVIQNSALDSDAVSAAAIELFEEALIQLVANRAREGFELKQFIEQRLASIAENVLILRAVLPEILVHQNEKLRAKLDALSVELDENRLSQEIIYIAQKSDVAEELDRLDAHLMEVRHTLQQPGPIGRRLDFLMQELNREANTLSSKSMASEITQKAVDLKVYIEQMREQVQNIE